MNQLVRFVQRSGTSAAGPAGFIVGGIALALGLSNAVYNVPGGHRAILFNRITGIREEVFGEGTHVKLPFIEREIMYHIRARPRDFSSRTGSKDLQVVNVVLRVLSKPDAAKLPRIYRRLGSDFDDRVLPSIVNEVLKGVVAQFTAAQLITERSQVSRMVRQQLTERASDFNILMDDVSITHLEFGTDYMRAVEAKQVAQQEAERAKFLVEKAQMDKEQIIVRAQGEARAAKMLSDVIRDKPHFLELRRIEAAREIAATMAHSRNRIYLSADTLLLCLPGSSVKE